MLMDGSPAALAGEKVFRKAAGADGLSLVVVDVLVPDPLTAVPADDGVGVETARAESLAVEGGTFPFRNFVPADVLYFR